MNWRNTFLASLATVTMGCSAHEPPVFIDPPPRSEFLEDSLYAAYDLDRFPGLTFRVVDHLPASVNIGPIVSMPNVAEYDRATKSLTLFYPVVDAAVRSGYKTFDEAITPTMMHEIGHAAINVIIDSIGPTRTSEYSLKDFTHSLKRIIELKEQSENSDHNPFAAFPGLFNQMVYAQATPIIENVLYHLIEEGLAMSYELDNAAPEEVSWPTGLHELLSSNAYGSFLYENGYALVHPITNEFGDEGIIEILRNPPEVKDFYDLPGWRERTIEALRERKGAFLADSINQAMNIPERYPEHTLIVKLGEQPDSVYWSGMYWYKEQTSEIVWENIRESALVKMERAAYKKLEQLATNSQTLKEYLDAEPDASPDTAQVFIETIRGVVEHELAHHKTHLIARREGIEFPSRVSDNYDLDRKFTTVLKEIYNFHVPKEIITFHEEHPEFLEYLIGRQMLEGIAEYYEGSTCDGIWSSRLTAVQTPKRYHDQVYVAGCKRYSPIIEEFGEEGIIYVLKNPPTPDEFWRNGPYRKRMLEELRE